MVDMNQIFAEKPRRLIDPNYLRSVLHYDPETGEFRWASKHSRNVRVGAVAGCFDNKGYWRIGLFGMSFPAHRLAWAMHYGFWPKLLVDHINRNRADNRICNLRLADLSENAANRPPQPNNTSGFKGVTFLKNTGKWQAQIRIRGQHNYLGIFDTPEQAYAAYCAAADKGYGSFARVA